MRKEIPKIKNVFPLISGIFSYMDFDFRIIDKSQLDILFVSSYGEKRVAPLVRLFVSDDSISDEKMGELAHLIESYYKINWDKLLDLLEIEYDPIHNFSDNVSEEITDTNVGEISKEMSGSNTGSVNRNRIDNLTSTDTKNLVTEESKQANSTDTKNLSEQTQGTVEEQMQGFNSTAYKNKDKDIESKTVTNTGTDSVQSTGSSTVNNTGTDTVQNTGTQTNQEERNLLNASQGKEESESTHTRSRVLERIGNIGNITTQQMLTQEIELWKWSFISTVLENVRDLTTLAIYF